MKCVSKEWYKGEQYRCVLASDTVPAVLPTDGTNVDGMEDHETFAPLSMFITPQQAGEGEAQEYYVHLNGTGAKYAQYSTYPELRTYAVESRTAPQGVRLRSAYRGYGCYTWGVSDSGNVGAYSAILACRVAPLVFIG